MKSLLRILSLFGFLVLSSCVFDKGTTFIDFGGKVDPKGALESGLTNAQVTSVSVVNDQLVINGSSLQGIESVKITDNGSFTKTFSIESKNSSQIISNGIDSLSIFVGQVFDLVIGNAYGQVVFPVTFTLQDNAVTSSKILDGEVMTADLANGAVTPAKLSTAGASAGSVLQFDGSNWNLINLNGLTYQGTWNADTNTPSFGAANCDNHNPGDYYAVSVTGSTFVDGESSWAAGDWIICSNGLWDKVINTTNITSVFGRTGAVTATLSDMTDVDSSLSSVDGQLLIFRAANSRYETASFIDFDWITGNVTFSNNLAVTGTGLTVGGTAVCLADGTNCTYPTPTSVVNSSGAAVVNASSGLDAVELQVGGVTGAQLNSSGTFVVNNFQVSGGTPGAGKVLMSDVSGNGTWQDMAIANITNLQTTLDSKVAKADVPACTDPTKQLVWDGTSWACLTFTDLNTNAGTICAAGEYLDGDGTCKSVAAGGADNSQAVNVQLVADNDSNASGEIQFLTGAIQQMVIDNSGNVGVGVLAPSAKLEVAGQVKITGGTPGAGQVLTSDAAGLATWELLPSNTLITDANNDTKVQVEESADENIIRFDTAGVERARIDANGNMIFGAPIVVPLAGTLVTVGGTMKVTTGNDICIDGGACLSTVDTNTIYTGGDGLTLTGTDFSVNVDGSTLETNLDILRVKDAGITDAKIVGVGVQKVISSAGNYLTYAPNGVSCALDQVLKLDLSGTWVCADDIDTTDNLGNHTATQNLDLVNFKLVGNGGSTGVEIDASGNVGIGAVAPGAKLEVAGQVKITGGTPGTGKILTSDATGLGSWQTPPSNTLIVDADNNTKIQVEESADENVIRFDTAGAERARIDALGNIIFGASTVTPLAGTLVTVGGTMKVSSGSDICIDGGACLSTVDTNTTYTGGDGLTLTGTDFAVNVDGSTLETDLDTLRVKDAGITDVKIVGVGVQKVSSSAGNYLTYAPNGTACTLNQVLKLDASGQWICANDIDMDTTYTGGDGLALTGTDFSINVDGSTIETNLDTLRVKDAGITDAKIVGVGVQKVTSSAGNYLTYSPSGVACTLSQVLKLDASGQWICADDTDTTDNLGSHIATQDLDLANFKLVGNGGSAGVEIDASGKVGVGVAAPSEMLEVNGFLKGSGFKFSDGGVSGKTYEFLASPTVGNIQPLGRFHSQEGAVSLLIQVQSATSAHSGTNLYLFQAGFGQFGDASWRKVLPLTTGRGHGDGAGGFDLYIRQSQDATFGNYGYDFGVSSNTNLKSLRTKFIALHIEDDTRGPHFADLSADIEEVAASAGDVYSIREQYIESKLGIGKSNPATALDVAGTVTATAFVGDGSGITGISAESSDNIGNVVISADSDSNTTGEIQFNTAGTIKAVIDNSGKMGIGQTTPSAKLHVAESTAGAAAAIFDLADNTAGNFVLRQGANDYLNVNTTDTSESITLGNTTTNPDIVMQGNVGIGTTTPGEKLEVNGNIKLSGTYGATWSQGQYPFKGYHFYSDDGTSYGPAWVHENTTSGNLLPTMFLQSNGDGALLKVDHGIQLGDMTMTALGTMPGQTVRTNLSGQSGADSYFNTGGNVGIGTASPQRSLQIEGGDGVEQIIRNTGVTTGNQSWGIQAFSGNLNFRTLDDGVTAETGVGKVMSLTRAGSVGIGTVSPSSKLDVSGTALVNQIQVDSDRVDSANRYFKVTSYGSDGVIRVNPGPASTLYLNREVGVARDMHVWDGTTNSIFSVIGSSGNVGVGTSTPASKLDIAGEVRLGNSAAACTTANEGAQRYNSVSKKMEYCNGSTWFELTSMVSNSVVQTITNGSSVNFAGLNGDSDKFYKIILQGKLVQAGANKSIRIAPNGDFGTVGFRNVSGRDFETGGTPTTDINIRNTGGLTMGFGDWGSDGAIIIEGMLAATTGKRRILQYNHGFTPDAYTDREIVINGTGWWNDTTTNITSLALDFNGGTFTGDVILVKGASPSALSGPDGHSLDSPDGSVVDALFADNAGNIGVGTTTPGKTLDVNGSIRSLNGHLISGNSNGAIVLNAGPDSAGTSAGVWFRADTITGDESSFTNLGFWDSNGNLGIGTDSPATNNKLQVDYSATAKVSIGGECGAVGSEYGAIALGRDLLGAGGCGNYNLLSRTTESHLFINRPTGGDMYFRENNLDQMIVKTGGMVGIGTTAPLGNAGDLTLGNASGTAGRLYIYGSTANAYSDIVTTNGNLHLDAGYGAGATGNGVYLNWYGGTVTHIGNGSSGYGEIRAATYTTSSDRRLKKNISTLENSLDKILSLRGVEYNFSKTNYTDRKQIGVIAQEIEEVFPELVSKNDEGYLAVSYDKLVAPLIESTKEQQVLIENNLEMFRAMQGQVEENTRRIASLEKEVEELRNENIELKTTLESMKESLCELNPSKAFCK